MDRSNRRGIAEAPGGYSTIRVTSWLVVGYLVLGALGLLLAIPPGYASPVFPAAGLALAAVLLFGNRVLPGVWLGSTLLELGHAAVTGRLSSGTVTAALVVGVGATLQAGAGRWLVQKGMGPSWRRLEREGQVLRFLLLGCVAAGLVSSSVSVAGLAATGVIELAEVPFTLWIWYVGDVVGMLVVAPLALCFLEASSTSERDRFRRVLVPMLAALGIVVAVFYGTSRWEAEAETRSLSSVGEELSSQLQDRGVVQREVLAAVRNFVEATPGFTFTQFDQFTRLTLRDHPDIFALQFDDLVEESRRLEFEETTGRQSPLGAYQITERNAEGRLVRAGSRPEYVPVRFVVPLAGNGPAVGFDILSEPTRRAAVETARRSGIFTVTAPVHLVQGEQRRPGMLEVKPAFDGAHRVVGFAVAVIKLDEMVRIATEGHVPAGIVFRLTDPEAPDGWRLIHESEGGEGSSARDTHAAVEWSTSLAMGQRTWVLSLKPTKSYWQAHRPWMAWAAGVGGLLFVAMLQVLLLGATGRAIENERRNLLLAASEERLKDAQRLAQLGNWEIDLRTNATSWSDETFRIYEADPAGSEASLEAFLRAVHPEDRDDVDAAYRQAFEGRASPGFTHRLLMTDGRVKFVQQTGHIVRDAEGSPVRVVGTVQDITERRVAEVAVRSSEALLRAIADSSPDSIFAKDREGRWTFANQAVLRLFGKSGSEVVGRTDAEIIGDPEVARQLAANDRQVMESASHVNFEEVVPSSTGMRRFLVTKAPLRDSDGGVAGIAGVAKDVTEVRKLQEHLAIASRLAAMGTLVTGVAHEVNNPLSGVLAGGGVAAETVQEARALLVQGTGEARDRALRLLEEALESLEDVRVGGQRIAEIIRDLSLFGRPDPLRTRVHLVDAVDLAIRWLPATLGARVTLRVEDLGAPDVLASSGQLGQVFLNLVTNAAKAIPPGRKGNIVVRLRPGRAGMACIEVEDDGAGIDPRLLEVIFDPFFTTRPAGEGRGTGLGLAICHAIVTSYGGDISVESEVGKGSTFRIELPAAPVEG